MQPTLIQTTTTEIKHCLHCKKPMIHPITGELPKTKRKVYCSTSCRVNAHYYKRKGLDNPKEFSQEEDVFIEGENETDTLKEMLLKESHFVFITEAMLSHILCIPVHSLRKELIYKRGKNRGKVRVAKYNKKYFYHKDDINKLLDEHTIIDKEKY